MTVRQPFLFVGGAPALDFVNTEIVSRGERKDLLEVPADLIRWMEESGLASPAEGRTMRAFPTNLQETWLREARALRGDLRKTFLHLASGGRLRSDDLRFLDAALAGSEFRLRVSPGRGRARLSFEPRELSPAGAIARSAAEFFAASDPSLVRRCEGTGCILLFHDSTKSHTRRWCSMAGCGNRAKAAAHYRRAKA
ncbi:MAG TPA: ABATE domain-containing protein [Thermoanaerobaculia bacterium]|nr:ABATE domain-containing protein [Thermoanaerobaculia bacterium]